MDVYNRVGHYGKRFFAKPFKMQQTCTIDDFELETKMESLGIDVRQPTPYSGFGPASREQLLQATTNVQSCLQSDTYTVQGWACSNENERLVKIDDYIRDKINQQRSNMAYGAEYTNEALYRWQYKLAGEVGTALWYCHRAGYSHNDVLAKNIVVCEASISEFKLPPNIVILDFGQADNRFVEPYLTEVDINREISDLYDSIRMDIWELSPNFYKSIKLQYLTMEMDFMADEISITANRLATTLERKERLLAQENSGVGVNQGHGHHRMYYDAAIARENEIANVEDNRLQLLKSHQQNLDREIYVAKIRMTE